jgi:hypothetical protein
VFDFTSAQKFKMSGMYPASDSTTAIQLYKADGSTAAVTVDTTNNRLGIGCIPSRCLEVRDTSAQLRLSYDGSNYTDFTTASSGNLTITPNGGKVSINATSTRSSFFVSGGSLATTAGSSLSLATLYYFTGNGCFLDFSAMRTADGTDWNNTELIIQRTIDATKMSFIKLGHTSSLGNTIQLGYNTTPHMTVGYNSGCVGINTTAPAKRLEVRDTSAQLRLSYDGNNYTDFTVNSDGDLTVDPSGTGRLVVAASMNVSGTVTADSFSGTIASATSTPTANKIPIADANGTLNSWVTNSGALQEIVKSSTTTLTTTECRNSVISNYGQSAEMILTLPTASSALGFLFTVSTTGYAVHLKAGPSDKIYLDGVALDDGDKVSCSSPEIGDAIALFTFKSGASTYDWTALSQVGIWVDGGT